jgi:hypothetical protein
VTPVQWRLSRPQAEELATRRFGSSSCSASATPLGGGIGDNLLDRVVVTTGTEAYRRSDGVAIVPAALLGP